MEAPERIWLPPGADVFDCTRPNAVATVEYLRVDIAERQIAELRAAIAGKPMDPSVTHGQFIEMAQTLHAACDGGRVRAEAAEADKARLSEELRELRSLFDAKGYLFCSGDYQIEVIARTDAALSGSGAGGWRMPDGWRLVPVEPTLGQQNAGWREVDKQGFATEDTEVAPIYRAMIAAAPTGEAS